MRRGIDETTSDTLADAGLKIGDLKKITIETLTDNYGLKKVAESVLSVTWNYQVKVTKIPSKA